MEKSPWLSIEEMETPSCVQAGGIYIDGEFERHMINILNGVDMDEETRQDCLRTSVEDFKYSSKKEFDDPERQYRVNLGARHLNHQGLGIKRGTITLKGNLIKSFFDMCLTQVIKSINEQMLVQACKKVLLVGGLGNSAYLRRSVTEEFRKVDCSVYFANDSAANAVADGAVIWYGRYPYGQVIHEYIMAYSFGVDINVPYDPNVPSHQGRRKHRHAAGYDYLINGWSTLIAKGSIIREDTPVRETYWCSYRTPNPHLDKFKVILFVHIGAETPGCWLRDPQGELNEDFKEFCEIEVDLNTMRKALKHRTGRDGDFYYLVFTILFSFGGTKLDAAVEWEQDVSIFYWDFEMKHASDTTVSKGRSTHGADPHYAK